MCGTVWHCGGGSSLGDEHCCRGSKIDPMRVLTDVDRFCLQVGETVPSFSLADQHAAAPHLNS